MPLWAGFPLFFWNRLGDRCGDYSGKIVIRLSSTEPPKAFVLRKPSGDHGRVPMVCTVSFCPDIPVDGPLGGTPSLLAARSVRLTQSTQSDTSSLPVVYSVVSINVSASSTSESSVVDVILWSIELEDSRNLRIVSRSLGSFSLPVGRAALSRERVLLEDGPVCSIRSISDNNVRQGTLFCGYRAVSDAFKKWQIREVSVALSSLNLPSTYTGVSCMFLSKSFSLLSTTLAPQQFFLVDTCRFPKVIARLSYPLSLAERSSMRLESSSICWESVGSALPDRVRNSMPSTALLMAQSVATAACVIQDQQPFPVVLLSYPNGIIRLDWIISDINSEKDEVILSPLTGTHLVNVTCVSGMKDTGGGIIALISSDSSFCVCRSEVGRLECGSVLAGTASLLSSYETASRAVSCSQIADMNEKEGFQCFKNTIDGFLSATVKSMAEEADAKFQEEQELERLRLFRNNLCTTFMSRFPGLREQSSVQSSFTRAVRVAASSSSVLPRPRLSIPPTVARAERPGTDQLPSASTAESVAIIRSSTAALSRAGEARITSDSPPRFRVHGLSVEQWNNGWLISVDVERLKEEDWCEYMSLSISPLAKDWRERVRRRVSPNPPGAVKMMEGAPCISAETGDRRVLLRGLVESTSFDLVICFLVVAGSCIPLAIVDLKGASSSVSFKKDDSQEKTTVLVVTGNVAQLDAALKSIDGRRTSVGSQKWEDELLSDFELDSVPISASSPPRGRPEHIQWMVGGAILSALWTRSNGLLAWSGDEPHHEEVIRSCRKAGLTIEDLVERQELEIAWALLDNELKEGVPRHGTTTAMAALIGVLNDGDEDNKGE